MRNINSIYIEINGEWCNHASSLFDVSKKNIQMELIELKEDLELKFEKCSPIIFWGKLVSKTKYPTLKQLLI